MALDESFIDLGDEPGGEDSFRPRGNEHLLLDLEHGAAVFSGKVALTGAGTRQERYVAGFAGFGDVGAAHTPVETE
ncbi:hypothetical protein KC992_02225 [Candidatus Saccharibacteria bacterium]|nr:hypothetical protein [Candidatus Saccharibacteria bacterium]